MTSLYEGTRLHGHAWCSYVDTKMKFLSTCSSTIVTTVVQLGFLFKRKRKLAPQEPEEDYPLDGTNALEARKSQAATEASIFSSFSANYYGKLSNQAKPAELLVCSLLSSRVAELLLLAACQKRNPSSLQIHERSIQKQLLLSKIFNKIGGI